MDPFILPQQTNPRVPGQPRPYRHRVPVQMRFSDIDILGHLNNSVYLNLFDIGKTGYFRQMLGHGVDWSNVGMVVAQITVNFFAPTFYDDPVEVVTMVESLGERSFVLDQRLVDMRDGQTHATCRTVMAGYDPSTGRSAPLRAAWVEAVRAYEGL